MYRTSRVAAGLFLVVATAASGREPGNLACSATHGVTCEGAVCRAERPEEGAPIYVSFDLSTVSGRGNLCTYTYCRDFVLVPSPGSSLDETLETLSGFTLSEKRGSTGDDLERPAIDYQLSISEDRKQFFLGNLESGGFKGWAGTCSADRKSATPGRR
jgi:hypothetical protein